MLAKNRQGVPGREGVEQSIRSLTKQTPCRFYGVKIAPGRCGSFLAASDRA